MGKEMALTIKQARELGMKDLLIIGGDGYGEFMWEIAGDAMEGTYWVKRCPGDPAMEPFSQLIKISAKMNARNSSASLGL